MYMPIKRYPAANNIARGRYGAGRNHCSVDMDWSSDMKTIRRQVALGSLSLLLGFRGVFNGSRRRLRREARATPRPGCIAILHPFPRHRVAGKVFPGLGPIPQ